MTTTYDAAGNRYRRELPMPNDRLPDGRIVIASCDQENGQYDVLVLNSTPGAFYSVLVLDAETLGVEAETVHPNIIPAAEDYADAIGGY